MSTPVWQHNPPPHICVAPTDCTCSSGALQPADNCPQHGTGEWPPRCWCGRFLETNANRRGVPDCGTRGKQPKLPGLKSDVGAVIRAGKARDESGDNRHRVARARSNLVAGNQTRMTPKQKVIERYPEAYLAPMNAGVYDVVVPSNRPSPGYRSHRALGAGTSGRLAWADAAKRILRRRYRQPVMTPGRQP